MSGGGLNHIARPSQACLAPAFLLCNFLLWHNSRIETCQTLRMLSYACRSGRSSKVIGYVQRAECLNAFIGAVRAWLSCPPRALSRRNRLRDNPVWMRHVADAKLRVRQRCRVAVSEREWQASGRATRSTIRRQAQVPAAKGGLGYRSAIDCLAGPVGDCAVGVTGPSCLGCPRHMQHQPSSRLTLTQTRHVMEPTWLAAVSDKGGWYNHIALKSSQDMHRFHDGHADL